jgi:hypothetical protein
MLPLSQTVKLVPVESDMFEAVGYSPTSRELVIKFKTTPPLSFKNVPGFRFDGLMSAVRPDAYYKTFIENKFLTKPAQLPH